METAPLVSAIGLALALLIVLVWILLPLHFASRGIDTELYPCMILPMFVAGVAWIFGGLAFQSACNGQPAWLCLLLRYYVVFLAMFVAIIAPPAMGFVCVVAFKLPPGELDLVLWLTPIVVLLSLVGILWWPGRAVHRWLRAPMDQLQRKVAVEAARNDVRLRQRLPRG